MTVRSSKLLHIVIKGHSEGVYGSKYRSSSANIEHRVKYSVTFDDSPQCPEPN